MNLTIENWLSIIGTVLVFGAVGIYSSRFVKTLSDFTVAGRKFGPGLVGSSLVGAFVGGSCIIGSAELAYTQGISALWFTLGAGLSCVLLAVFFADPLRKREVETIPEFLSLTYGKTIRPWVSFYIAFGMFLQVSIQILAAIPIIKLMMPIAPQLAGFVATILLLAYVVFGGFWGASLVGLVKIIFLCIGLFGAAIGLFFETGGFAGLAILESEQAVFSFFPQKGHEIFQVMSVVIGLISTQTYLQCVFAAKDVKSARQGLLFAAVLIPLIGAVSTGIGLFMRFTQPGLQPTMALPIFFLNYVNPWLGGMTLTAIILSTVITGASLTLGISTILTRDIYLNLNPARIINSSAKITRIFIVVIAIAAYLFAMLNLNTLILDWAFLAMALRGVTVFIPLFIAVFCNIYASHLGGKLAIIFAPAISIIWALLFPQSIDPLCIGLPLSVIFLMVGYFYNNSRFIQNKGLRG